MYRLMLTVLVLSLLSAYPAAALEEVSSSTLIDQAKAYDKREVIYSGEVIGDIFHVGDHVWLNVSDGSNAIGIWTGSSLARSVRIPGRYNQSGDSIRVSGTFYRACPQHGGDMDLHADSITLVSRGRLVSHEVQGWKVWLAILLTVAAAACMVSLLVGTARKSVLRRKP